MDKIDSFKGEFSFLSNFHPSPITINGIEFPTVEHAYQAAKTLDEQERFRIAGLERPGQAKYAGRRVKLRSDWEDVKVEVMTELVRHKFTQNEDLGKSLVATGDAELIEGNTWNDRFWGVCRGKGENHLGKILMKVRDELNDETK